MSRVRNLQDEQLPACQRPDGSGGVSLSDQKCHNNSENNTERRHRAAAEQWQRLQIETARTQKERNLYDAPSGLGPGPGMFEGYGLSSCQIGTMAWCSQRGFLRCSRCRSGGEEKSVEGLLLPKHWPPLRLLYARRLKEATNIQLAKYVTKSIAVSRPAPYDEPSRKPSQLVGIHVANGNLLASRLGHSCLSPPYWTTK